MGAKNFFQIVIQQILQNKIDIGTFPRDGMKRSKPSPKERFIGEFEKKLENTFVAIAVFTLEKEEIVQLHLTEKNFMDLA